MFGKSYYSDCKVQEAERKRVLRCLHKVNILINNKANLLLINNLY